MTRGPIITDLGFALAIIAILVIRLEGEVIIPQEDFDMIRGKLLLEGLTEESKALALKVVEKQ